MHQRRPSFTECKFYGFAKGCRVCGAVGSDAEALREAHEVGIVQVARDQAVSVSLLLYAPHVPERAVVEHHNHHAEAVPGCGCQFEGLVAEAAIAGDRKPRIFRLCRSCMTFSKAALLFHNVSWHRVQI